MTSLSRPLPALPLEILEQVVDLHGEHEDEGWREDFNAPTAQRNHSKTLLACHMVSRQFRVCALRVICRKTFVNLYDTPERLRHLQELFLGEAHPLSQLVSPVWFIKELAIFLTDYKVGGYSRPKDVIVAVLKTVADKVPMETLSIFGNTTGKKVYLPSSGPETLQALEAIIQLPSVVSLYIRDVGQIPYQLAGANTHLHTLSISNCEYHNPGWFDGMTPPPSFTATLPQLDNLIIHQCTQFPEGLQLPAIQTIDAVYDSCLESESVWAVIQRSTQTLANITIHDYDEISHYDKRRRFPQQLDLSSFPRLETFAFSYLCWHNNEKFQTLEELASFLNPKHPIPNLRVIELEIFLDGRSELHDEFLSRVGKHYPWGLLDKALACGHFAGVNDVSIYLDISFYEDVAGLLNGTVNLADTAKTLQADIMDSFSRSKTLSIPIKVIVDVNTS